MTQIQPLPHESDSPRAYTVQVAHEIATLYTDWTRVDELDSDWFKVVLHDDGTAEVLLAIGVEPPSRPRRGSSDRDAPTESDTTDG